VGSCPSLSARSRWAADIAASHREGPLALWIRFEIDFVGRGVDVLPLLVYGDPPQARIDGDRFVHLQSGSAAAAGLETSLVLRLRAELNLTPEAGPLRAREPHDC
jgi:hypothetical protein